MRRVIRQKLVDYEVYIANDGTEFDNEQECIHHDKIYEGSRKVCETCGGSGYVNHRTQRYFDGGMYGDHQWHDRETSDECPTCKGKGYLEKKISWE